jgi:hypothetical protein
MRNAYKILAGKSEGKKLLGTPKSKWADTIKTDLKETGFEHVERFLIRVRIKISVGLL